MKYSKTSKSIRNEFLSNIAFIMLLDCFIVAGVFFDGPPTTEKIVIFSIIGIAFTCVFGYSLLRDYNKTKNMIIRVADHKLYFSEKNIETSVDLKSISKIVKGIRKGKVLFLRVKSPDFGWWALKGYENFENLSQIIIDNAPNAKLHIKNKGLISFSKY